MSEFDDFTIDDTPSDVGPEIDESISDVGSDLPDIDNMSLDELYALRDQLTDSSDSGDDTYDIPSDVGAETEETTSDIGGSLPDIDSMSLDELYALREYLTDSSDSDSGEAANDYSFGLTPDIYIEVEDEQPDFPQKVLRR